METYDLDDIITHWQPLAPVLSVPRNEDEYDRLVAFLDSLIDEVGNNETHVLVSLMDTVGTLISIYDEKHYPFSEGNPVDVLKHFMNEYGLTENNLPELGTPEIVLDILSGKIPINTRQIRELSRRFKVNPATFLNQDTLQSS